MRALVTGCAGFIGANCAKRLVDAGHEVVGIDSVNDYYDTAVKRARLAQLVPRSNFEFLEGDLLDTNLLDRVFASPPTKILHLAARAGVRASLDDPMVYVRDNVAVTTELLSRAAKADVEHFVYASSSSVYGEQVKIPFSETDPVDSPISPYAATKVACERMAHTFHHLYGLPVTGLRFFTVYGPKGRPDMAVWIFSRALLDGKPIRMFGDGSTARDYTFIDDIVDGVERVLDKPLGCQIVNLGNDHPVTLGDMIATMGRVFGREPVIERLPQPAGDVSQTHADISKARSLYRYDPKTSLEQGLTRVREDLEGIT